MLLTLFIKSIKRIDAKHLKKSTYIKISITLINLAKLKKMLKTLILSLKKCKNNLIVILNES